MVLHAQQPKKRCEQDLLPQGEPSFEPLLSGWGSRLAFKEKPTKPNRRPCKPKRTPYEVAPDLLIPAAAAAADGWLVVWVGCLVGWSGLETVGCTGRLRQNLRKGSIFAAAVILGLYHCPHFSRILELC